MTDGNAEQVRVVAEQVADTVITRFSAQQPDLTKKLTMTEVGVIVSIFMSGASLIFTAGFVYGQVQTNSRRLDRIEPKVETLGERIERIDVNVDWLRHNSEERR
jgi:hypothetical protein